MKDGSVVGDSLRSAPTDPPRHGYLPLRHASSPSLGRSGADFPVGSRSQGEVPVSRLGFVDSLKELAVYSAAKLASLWPTITASPAPNSSRPRMVFDGINKITVEPMLKRPISSPFASDIFSFE